MTSSRNAVILIGAMGSGKSHIARELARLAHWPARDVDSLIVIEAGKSIAAIFAEEGEAAFRALEKKVLRDTLRCGGVIATGGGVVTQKANRELLQQSHLPVVYLRASAETLAARIRLQPGTRPLIDGDGALSHAQTVARVEAILHTRRPFYESCATLAVDTDERAPRDVAHEIWYLLAGQEGD